MPMQLDRSRPFGATFGADAGTMPLFQDNVYFDTRGNVVDCWYNRQNSPHLFAADAPTAEAPASAPAPAPEPAPSTDGAALLSGKSDAEIYSAALKLRAMLDDAGDADVFVPDPADREANEAFILRHAGG